MSIEAVTLNWYRREDYARLLTIFEDADKLPATFDEWLKKAEHGEEFLRKSGKRVIRIVIDPDEITACCEAQKLKLDSHGRNQFATFKARDIIRGRNN